MKEVLRDYIIKTTEHDNPTQIAHWIAQNEMNVLYKSNGSIHFIHITTWEFLEYLIESGNVINYDAN